jgi:hypothetical protein
MRARGCFVRRRLFDGQCFVRRRFFDRHSLLFALLLGATLALPDRTAHAWGMVAYRPATLAVQQTTCPPQGPNPWQGCDQCLVRIYQPLFPFHRIFCGRLDQEWCPWLRECTQCNGSCSIIWQDSQLAYVSILQPTGSVHTAIDQCRQWATQTHCTSPGGPVPGAYVLADELEWIPIHQGDYRGLHSDFDYLIALSTYEGAMATNLEEAWRHRIGIFAVLASHQGARRPYWERAANLVAWYYITHFSDPGEWEMVLAQNHIPAIIGGQDWLDLVDIFESTCSAAPFLDCWHPVDAATWGGIKQRFRAPEE